MAKENFFETHQVSSSIVPVNLATAANNGDWHSLVNYDYIVILFFKGAGTAGDDPVLTVTQATDNAGTSEKALDFTTIYEMSGTLTGIANFTRQTQSAANTYTNASSAESEGLFGIQIHADDLDVANGFTHVQFTIPDTGTNAQIGCALAILGGPRFAGKAETLPSAVA